MKNKKKQYSFTGKEIEYSSRVVRMANKKEIEKLIHFYIHTVLETKREFYDTDEEFSNAVINAFEWIKPEHNFIYTKIKLNEKEIIRFFTIMCFADFYQIGPKPTSSELDFLFIQVADNGELFVVDNIEKALISAKSEKDYENKMNDTTSVQCSMPM